jgi:AcrR family transcriptional regulator
MPRAVNHAVYTVRREAFLDAAEKLIHVKGYEQMSVQDLLEELDTSRGAFYHYFDSKLELMEAVTERLADRAMELVAPIIADPALPAMTKLDRVFSGIARFKAEQLELVLAVLEVWMADSNALVREKLRRLTGDRLGPLLTAVITQGVAEGSFRAESPERTATVLLTLIQGMQEVAGRLFLERRARLLSFEEVRDTFAAYARALERILGAAEGSFEPLDETALRFWFD